MKPDLCLTIFCKNPFLTETKTRLKLETSRAQALYHAFLLDTIARPYPAEADKFLHLYPAVSEDFRQNFSQAGFTHLIQKGDDLGERMHNFFVWGYNQGYRKMVLLGSDQPTLPPNRISRAFELLDRFPAVLGPSMDGGYYLIGLRKPDRSLFTDIAWGESGVLEATVSRLGSSFGLLEPWYDVDRPEDLEFLKTHLKALQQSGGRYLPTHTINRLW
ncbi:MAG: TIGR04282 family arsenosugar biosynthesis glycosyltransferase [bacterium]